MRRLLSVCLGLLSASLLLTLCLPNALAQSPRSVMIDRVAAVVNKEVILESELLRRVRQAQQSLARSGQRPPSAAQLREQVLDRMVTDLALLQRAAQLGVVVDDATLTRAIGAIAQQNGVTVTGLRDQLEAEGVTFSHFREDIKDEITLTRLREREVDNRLRISDAEVDVFLASQGQSLAKTEELLLRQILLVVPEGSDDARKEARQKARSLATDLIARAEKGADFAELVRTHSAAGDAARGGSLGWRSSDRLPTLFVEAVKDKPAGSIVGPVDSANGVHVIKVDDRRSRLSSQLVDVFRARHILIRVDGQTSEPTALRRLDDVKRRLTLGESFANLAKEISQDPGSAARGGELDWAYPGDMVPEFERAALGLAVGQVSEPVRSVFGYHLIELIERKREPLTEDRLRLAARLALRERKLAEAIDEWTREVRANSYVEMKKAEE